VIGMVLSVLSLLIAVGATIAGRMSPLPSIRTGTLLICLTLVLLVMASEMHSFILFVISSISGGLGYGFTVTGGIGLAAMYASPEYKAQFLSSVFVVSYLFQGASAFGGGLASTAYGFSFAIWMLAIVVGLIALITLLSTLIIRKEMFLAK
jgi:MFS family permease